MAYNIKRTDGSEILVQTGTVDGPANTTPGFVQKTDLDLYGQGALNWGIGVDQNQVRLLENWAVGAIQIGTDGGGNPLWRPKNEDEIGGADSGTGINNPSIGQTWFNTDNDKLYVCKTTAPLAWQTAGADPDLFVPAAGGTFTGNVEIAKSSPKLQITATDGSDMWIEFRDPAQKLLIAVDQQLFPIGATNHPYDPGPLTIAKEVDLVVFRKSVGATTVSQITMRDDYVDFKGGTFGIAGADAGKIRTPSTTTADHDNVVTTKGFVDTEFVSIHGDIMDGNLRIEKVGPQMVLEAFLPSAGASTSTGNIYFDHSDENGNGTDAKGLIRSVETAGSAFLGLQKRDTSAIQSEIRLYSDRIETFGNGKIRTPQTIIGDNDATLTTKKYVDDINTAITGAYLLNSGDTATGVYQFGPTNNDFEINNGTVISTTGSTTTEISGSIITSTNGSGSTEITGSKVTVLQGTDLIELLNGKVTIDRAGEQTKIDGEKINQIEGVNTSQMDASGLIFTTTTAAFRNTLIRDGDIKLQASTNNWTNIDGGEIISQGGTAGETTTIDGPEVTIEDGDGITTVGSKLTTIESKSNTLFPILNLVTPNGNGVTARGTISFVNGSANDANDHKARIQYIQNALLDNGTTTTNEGQNHDILVISKYDQSAGTSTLPKQEIKMYDHGTAFIGGSISFPNGNVLIQRKSGFSAGLVGGLRFQSGNSGATGPSTEFQSHADLEYEQSLFDDKFTLWKRHDNTSVKSGHLEFTDTEITLAKYQTNGTSIGARLQIQLGHGSFEGGALHLTSTNEPTVNNTAVASRTFIQPQFPTVPTRVGDLCITDGTAGSNPTEPDMRIWIAYTAPGNVKQWISIWNSGNTYPRV